MTRIVEYKKHLAEGEKTFLDEYLPSINQLLTELESKGVLINNLTSAQVDRIMEFIRCSNAPLILKNNMFKIFDPDTSMAQEKLKKLNEIGFKTDNIAEQFCAVMCHGYQVLAERLKLHFVSIINFSVFGLEDAHRKQLGRLIGILKREFPENKFVTFLDTGIRNAVTHYSYFFEKGELVLCNGYFDESPKKMSLTSFMIESKNLNVLTDAFLLCFLDKYRFPPNPGESLLLE